ncbi:precorrin-2 C(20)-methyltransferase [Heliorestis acidaminivorans]|uniref:Precorrin-2 C(20)-methyltransferase n=1 Tax=Heliorestis acidaminivorans TaxID=553427 RepID=A0A6I0F1T4_9FIRM|nr:precorrin-2 C(20)-methyltransferase [Heliorestis acidaminivorans]KAB2953415.1 precorrin-2 C(20)-methyltransferase [Heliorestis acidaminivorans]
MSAIFYGIGVGPGDPELLTHKATRILNQVEVVIAPKSRNDRASLALTIAKEYLNSKVEIHTLLFPMTYEEEKLTTAWQESISIITEALDKGKSVAFITLGDPMLYSTYIYLHKLLQCKRYQTEIIPGIPSFCAAAARTGQPLAEGKETLTIIPAISESDDLDALFAHSDNLVLMKVYKEKDQIIERLEKHGLKEQATLISRCGLDGERIVHNLDEIRSKPVNYLSLILARRNK